MVGLDRSQLRLKPIERTDFNSAVFQAGGLVVVLVEVMRKAYLASIVPVVVNSILNEHQVIVDIIAFVSKGDFPRSRLGEKQRGKILASWVTRKMRTIAQFGIRDADGADSQITEVAEPRSRVGSVVGKGSSLRNVETIDARPINGGDSQQSHQQPLVQDYSTLPTEVSATPAAHYESSIVESPPLVTNDRDSPDETPVDSSTRHSYFPFDNPAYNQPESADHSPPELPAHSYEDGPYNPHPNMKNPAGPVFEIIPPKPRHPPTRNVLSSRDSLPSQQQLRHQHAPLVASGRSSSYQSSSQQQDLGGRPGAGRLRVANAGDDDEEVDWPQEALMHMNLASASGGGPGGSDGRGGSNHRGWDGYDGRGYGSAL